MTLQELAHHLDANDSLAQYRQLFHFPQHNGKDVIYFCGNSLGLQPRETRHYVLRELEHWANEGVEGHFRGEMPWKNYHHFFKEKAARVVGALPAEVVLMNTLTVNLHLMMMTFYRPTASRYKIVMEAGAFPSDQYAVESQVKMHGFAPEDAIIEVSPREGEYTLRPEDILETIRNHGQSVALVMFGGVNYYTGQLYDMAAITEAGHEVGARVGFDLAHAAGNVKLSLHDWGCDFAVWCTYKYLNSGPGGVSGVFVHERHAQNPELQRCAGWWGHDEAERFQMRKGFKPMYGADGWQLSNAQIFSMAPHLASLEIFDKAGMEALNAKTREMVSFLNKALEELPADSGIINITPRDMSQRGSQTSLLTDERGRRVFEILSERGIIVDWREPNVIRLAPTALYNSFSDIYFFMQTLIEVVG